MIRKVRAWLVTALLLVVTARALWWTVEPLVPYLLICFVLITIIGFIYYRTTKW